MLVGAFGARGDTFCKAQELRSRTQREKSLFVPYRAAVKTLQYAYRLSPHTGKCRSKSYDKVVPIGLC